MTRSRTPWGPRSRARPGSVPRPRAAGVLAGLLAGAALLAPAACVTRDRFDRVAGERDRLAAERDALARRVERLETSNESLAAERVELLDQIEDLRQRREALERDVRTLGTAHEELQEELAATERRLQERSDALAAREAEMARLQSSYDGLVADLQAEVEAGRMAVERLKEGLTFALPNEVLFAPGSAVPRPEGRAVVRRLAERLGAGPERIEVHGHTDAVPVSGDLARRFPSNWELAGARAASVLRILVEAGIDPERLVAVSHGEHDPVAPNDTAEGRARNRRIEIRLIPPADALAAPGDAS